MFYVELKPENNNKNIYEATHVLGYTFKLEPPHPKTQNAKFRNALTASDMVIQKAFAIEKRDASCVQKIIRLLTIYEKLNLRMSNVYYVKEIIQPIIKASRSTKIYKKKIFPYITEEGINNQTTTSG